MLRSTATRSLLKSFTKVPTARSSYIAASIYFRNASPLRQLNNNRPQVRISIARPTTTSLLYATTKAGPPFDKIDPKAEQEYAQSRIEPHPSEVSGESSVRHVFEQSQGPKVQDDEMLGAIKADLGTIKETFSLAGVPKESLYIGAAGVLPYAATSLSTVFLAYDINQAHASGHGIVFSPETAHQLLDIITPIQIGYGAVVRHPLKNFCLCLLTHGADYFFSWSYPLGSRVRWIWRSPQLSSIHVWSHCSGGRMANDFYAS
jgi:hypothetical protein